ncbi:MAG: ABC transporter substrate-binding protein [Firmicutes bacterium]|jgi:branched-chain amino acid transport system substrate-binding protein|nr:ABC transporter substrate-binding protein [Bacillota bacterium]
MRNPFRWLLVALVGLVVCFCVVPVVGADPIKVGLHAPLTGFAAADGLSVKQSVELAAKQINDADGINGQPIQLVIYDDRADAKEAVAVAHKLIEQDKVVAVVGGSYSAPMRAVALIYQQSKVPVVGGFAVHPDITRAGDYVFRVGMLGPIEGAAAGEVAGRILGAKTACQMTMDNEFGRALAEGFRQRAAQLGIKILWETLYPLGEKDFTPYLARLRQLNPDVIFVSGYYNEAAQFCKQAKDMGVKSQILGEEGFDSPKFIEIAGKAAEGVIIATNLNRDDPRPAARTFIDGFRKLYKMEPDMVGESNYDAFLLIADSLRRANCTDPKAVRDAIVATSNFDGATGVVLGFNALGECTKPIQVQIVKDGQFPHYGEVSDPAIITPPDK